MKNLLRCVLGLVAMTWAGCATAPRPKAPDARSVPPAEAHEADPASTKGAGLIVISAVYGSGTHYTDVTNRVNDLLRDPLAYLWAKPKWLLADPTPGWNKALVIVYELDGKRRIFCAGEGGTVSVGRLIANAEEPAAKTKKKKKNG